MITIYEYSIDSRMKSSLAGAAMGNAIALLQLTQIGTVGVGQANSEQTQPPPTPSAGLNRQG